MTITVVHAAVGTFTVEHVIFNDSAVAVYFNLGNWVLIMPVTWNMSVFCWKCFTYQIGVCFLKLFNYISWKLVFEHSEAYYYVSLAMLKITSKVTNIVVHWCSAYKIWEKISLLKWHGHIFLKSSKNLVFYFLADFQILYFGIVVNCQYLWVNIGTCSW